MKEFDEDPFGLLDRPQESSGNSLPPALSSRFSEIIDFLGANGVPPSADAASLRERQLGHWLQTMLNREDLITQLHEIGWITELRRIQSILGEPRVRKSRIRDPFGLLNIAKSTGVQQLRNVSKIERNRPDFVARRQPCTNFDDFADKFESAVALIENGQLVPLISVAGKIIEGSFFVINDLLGYVDEITGEPVDLKFESGDRTRFDGRTRVIFENGTESNMMLRSLEKSILQEGYLLAHVEDDELEVEREVAGFLYVVRSKRKFEVSGAELYKIGFTRTSVERRLAKAKTEAAYLFGEVELVVSYRCLGIDPSALESAMHNFFAPCKVEIEINMGSGNLLRPQEWFAIEPKEIDRAVFLALESELSNYKYVPGHGISAND